ncbi:MAG: 6-phosphofructokinase, partial [Mucinivorans sp.]
MHIIELYNSNELEENSTSKDFLLVQKEGTREVKRNVKYYNLDAVISIGGDGSQRISQRLMEQGLDIVGVPKTIDNDLSATDVTFGFQTAVHIATDAVDKLRTTAASHNRTFILEV